MPVEDVSPICQSKQDDDTASSNGSRPSQRTRKRFRIGDLRGQCRAADKCDDNVKGWLPHSPAGWDYSTPRFPNANGCCMPCPTSCEAPLGKKTLIWKINFDFRATQASSKEQKMLLQQQRQKQQQRHQRTANHKINSLITPHDLPGQTRNKPKPQPNGKLCKMQQQQQQQQKLQHSSFATLPQQQQQQQQWEPLPKIWRKL